MAGALRSLVIAGLLLKATMSAASMVIQQWQITNAWDVTTDGPNPAAEGSYAQRSAAEPQKDAAKVVVKHNNVNDRSHNPPPLAPKHPRLFW